jgi:hypothetical protein
MRNALSREAFREQYINEAGDEVCERLEISARAFAGSLERDLPDGCDKTVVLRKLRELMYWAFSSACLNPDGSIRDEYLVHGSDCLKDKN